MKAHFILYVADQIASTAFYKAVLELKPTLNVPGMTEFVLGDKAVLGLMPLAGASKLLGCEVVSHRDPRTELYLLVDDPKQFHARALAAGAREISPLLDRDWGHAAAYSIDNDGNVIAFASPTVEGSMCDDGTV